MDLHVAVLGGTQAWDGDRRLDLGTPKQHAVLAALALYRGHAVPVDRLVDLVWGDDVPVSVGTTLQGYVAGLRRALEPERPARAPAAVLVLEGQGYALRLGPEALDAARLEKEAVRARGHEAPAEVLRSTDQLLALWRGDPYAALGDHPDVVAERDRLSRLRLALHEERAAARLALGEDVAVAAELAPLAAAHPLREGLWALLVRALVGAGRQAEALEALQRVREALSDELGVDPGPELSRLQLAVLRQEVVSPPTPQPAVGRGRWPLVGHRRELDDLVALLPDESGEARSRFAVVVGEPGIGKSRLCQELASTAVEQGVRVVVGRCAPDDAPALWPWTQVLAGLHLTMPSSTEDEGRFTAREELVARLLASARERPTLVVLEDLHWADSTSLLVLRRLVAAVTGSRLLVVVTTRPESISTSDLLAAAESLAREHALRIEMTGLDIAGCTELFGHVSGHQPDRVGAAALADRTGGNPFFVVEVARSGAADLPAGVRDVLERRLTALPAGTRDLLAVAAVLGRDLRSTVLADAAGVTPTQALDGLEESLRAGLLEETEIGRFRFGHALVRETLLHGLTRTRLADLHERAARATQAHLLPGDESALAHHWLSAGPQHAAAAWRAARTAAAAARAMHGYDESASLLTRGLALMDVDAAAGQDDRAHLLLELADALRLAGRLVDLRPVVHQVLALPVGDDLRLRAALLPSEGAFWLASPYGEVDEVVVGALRGLLDRLPDGDDPDRCRVMVALASEIYYGARVAEREALVDEAVAMADRLQDERLVLRTCLSASVSVWRSARTAEQYALADRACDIARRVGDAGLLGSALTARVAAANDLGRVQSLLDGVDAARTVARAEHQPFEQVLLNGLEVAWRTMRGETDAATSLVAEMHRLSESMRLPQLADSFVAAEVMRLVWSGDLVALLDLVEAGEAASRIPLTPLHAVLLCRTGRVETARAYLESRDLRIETDDWLSPAIWSLSAEVALYLGDVRLASATYERLAPLVERPATAGSGVVYGPVDLFLAYAALACGERAAATAHADDAEELARRWEAPLVEQWVRDERSRWGF